jgi:transcriptional regulator with XRE-family HTH domain
MLETYVKHAEAVFKYPKPMDTSGLGERMRDVRKRHKLNLEQVAEEIGVSVSALSQIETGATRPKPETFVKWCAFFGENQNYILFGEAEPAELKRLRGLGAMMGNRPKSRFQE